MNDNKSPDTVGAPIRTFIIISMIWILGRIAWGSDAILSKDHIGLAEIGSRAQPTIAAVNRNLGSSWRTEATIRDWLKRSPRAFEIDSKNAKIRTNSLRWQRNLVLDNDVGAKDLLVNEYTEHRRNPDRVVEAKEGSFHSGPCCKKQSGAENQHRIKVAANEERNVKPSPRSRFSAYFWLFAREDSISVTSIPLNPALQQGTAQYGGSQVGAILTYRLSGDRKRNLAIYSRLSTPLAVKNSGELGLGVKIKPVRNIPISLYAEKRFRESSAGDSGTAIFLAGGSGPDQLMPGIFLETYGQAGYVFQDDSSYFFDGSASILKNVSTIGARQISMGGAVWAGGQEGAHRIDIGPRISIKAPIGNASTRISIDWRQRVAGNAEPDSGLAISLGTSF